VPTAALVATPPILIDPVGYSRQFNAQINPMGFFQVGANLYLVLQTDAAVAAKFPIGVWLSIDSGATWIEQDAANHPAAAAPGYGGKAVSFDGATIRILYTDNATSKQIVIPFSAGTNTYGAPSASSPVEVNGPFPAIYKQSNGTLVVPIGQGIGAANKLYYMTLIAGAWSALTALGAVANATVYGVVADPSDRGHLLYQDGAGNLVYALISAAFALGAPTTLETVANWDANDIDQRIIGNSLYVTWTDQTILKVAIGTPLSAPVFTTYIVGTVPISGTIAYPTLAVDKNGNPVVFAAWTDYSGSPVDQLLMWTFDGVSSWGSPVLFYDEITNPPANSVAQLNQFIHTGAATQFANGTWVFATALEIHTSNTFCGGHILLGSLPPAQSANPGPAGRTFVPLIPNQFDFCLHREYRLFCNIDYEAKGCGRLPDCFRVDEREWGDPA
jgi:hypothetical protein